MSASATNSRAASREPIRDFLSGDGELGALLRDYPWDTSPLGPPESWPQSLKMAIRIMLTSRQPIWIGWGEDLKFFYNDPYKSIIGGKHPWALARPTREVWSEIWPQIGPMLDTALGGDEGTYVESQLLIMERNGYPEETYYTYSYSPIPNDDGTVGGIFCANSEDTQRVIGERQLALLKDLAADAGHARNWREACARSALALERNPHDLPFAMIYIAERGAPSAELAGASGIAPGHPAAPETIAVNGASPWPIGEVLQRQSVRVVSNLETRFGADIPAGPWPHPPTQAAIIPVLPTGDTGRAGVLVVGLNRFRLFDDNYRGFLGLAAGQIAAAIANAQAYEEERRRAEALAELDRAKTAFFSNVSHEFRTPLTLMLGPIEDMLQDSAGALLPPSIGHRLETAHRNSLRLLKLVNSLLDFSRIEAGRIGRELRAGRPGAADRGTGVQLRVGDRAGRARSGDPLRGAAGARLCRSRHVGEDRPQSPVERVQVHLRGRDRGRAREFAGSRSAVLVVRDTGVGIPQSELPRLFERFHRIEGQKSRSFEGSGIGLALVQELVKLHGGTDRGRERGGQGRRLHDRHSVRDAVTSPRTRSASRARASRRRCAPAPSSRRRCAGCRTTRTRTTRRTIAPTNSGDFYLQGRTAGARILVADDNADMRAYVRRLLGSRWQVETVVGRRGGAGGDAGAQARSGADRRHDAAPRRLRPLERSAQRSRVARACPSSCFRRAPAKRRGWKAWTPRPTTT